MRTPVDEGRSHLKHEDAGETKDALAPQDEDAGETKDALAPQDEVAKTSSCMDLSDLSS